MMTDRATWPPPTRDDRTGLRLLIVEDDARLAWVFLDFFESAGHRVVWVDRVADATEQLAGDWPQLVITDHALPDGTAFDVLEAARVPVFVSTGQVDEELHGDLRVAGAINVFVKPFSLPDLACAIWQATGRPTTSRPGVAGGGPPDAAFPEAGGRADQPVSGSGSRPPTEWGPSR